MEGIREASGISQFLGAAKMQSARAPITHAVPLARSRTSAVNNRNVA